MGAELARIVTGAVDQGGFPPAQELRPHQIQARRIDDPAVMADHMAGQDMTDMTAMMGGSMSPGMMDPDASGTPWSRHELHHPSTTPEVAE